MAIILIWPILELNYSFYPFNKLSGTDPKSLQLPIVSVIQIISIFILFSNLTVERRDFPIIIVIIYEIDN